MFPLVKMAQIFPPLLAPPLKRIKVTMNNPWCQSDKILKGSFISMLYVRTWYIMIIFHESCKEGHFTGTISVPAPGNSFFALFPRCAALSSTSSTPGPGLRSQVSGLRSASFSGSLHFLAAGSAHLRAEFRVRLQIFKEISISIEPLLGKQKIT